MVKLIFKNFWPGFESEPNIFQGFFDNNPEISELLIKNGIFEVIFHSIFKPKLHTNLIRRKIQSLTPASDPILPELSRNSLNIWFSGENLRPPLDIPFDGFLSFDLDKFDGRNTYFPLIYLSLNPYETNRHPRLGKNYEASFLTEKRKLSQEKIPNSICIIAGPHPIRTAAIDALRKDFRVDLFGGIGNSRLEEKYSIARKYQYMICLENDLYPGYVTEKLVEAYVCETVPLYWGQTTGSNYLNYASMFNLNDFVSIGGWAETISNTSNVEYVRKYEQPLLLFPPPINQTLEEFFSKTLDRKIKISN